MSHIDVYKKFLVYFKVREDDIDCWFPNGKGSIRVRMQSREELVFTYIGLKNWKIETIHSFMEGLKSEF